MSTSPVEVHVEGKIGHIVLNRPEALHALNLDMCEIITEALKAWAHDPEIAAILIRHASGSRGFCAGGDIRMLAASGAKDGVEARTFFAAEYRLNTIIHNYKKPYIALMDGVTMGGGVGISVHGSHRISTERTLFAMPETGIGLFPDVGGGWFLPRLDGELGMWLALTCARLKGADVVAAGIGTHYIESAKLGPLSEKLNTSQFKGDVHAEIASLLSDHETNVGELSFAPHIEAINRCFSAPSVEEVLERLKAEGSDWANTQLEAIAAKSPLTLKIAFRQLREGANVSSFEDNMRNEYRIGARQVMSADFQEGVRAVIIDKDNAPNWPSKSLAEVSADELEKTFATLGRDELTFD